MLRIIAKLVRDWLDPVCQNQNAVMYGTHRGYCVRMRPVIADGRVSSWVADADEAARIDRSIDSGELEDLTDPNKAMLKQMMAGQSAGQQQASGPSADPPVLPPQPTFNPQGIPGI